MAKESDISIKDIRTTLFYEFALDCIQIQPLAQGADLYNTVYRIDTIHGKSFFLKIRRANFQNCTLQIPICLHHQFGLKEALAPLPTVNGRYFANSHNQYYILYPFVEGYDAFKRPLSERQWHRLGEIVSALHQLVIPDELTVDLAREKAFADNNRRNLHEYLRSFPREQGEDELSRAFLEFFKEKKDFIGRALHRADRLSGLLQGKNVQQVLCHGDLHGGNVMTDKSGNIYLVDWDSMLLAPREYDLMHIGAGIGGVWNNIWEEKCFYQGYGDARIDPVLLTYYSYERIINDIIELSELVCDPQAPVADRKEGLRQMRGQFLVANVMEKADERYRKVSHLVAKFK